MARKPDIMTTEEGKKKAFAIALAIQKNNPEWTASISGVDHDAVYLTHKDGATAFIAPPYSPKQGDKIHGYFRVPKHQDHSTGPLLEVGVSIERPVDQIARNFERRLLPAVLDKWQSHLIGKKKEEDYKAAYRAAVMRMAKAAGVESPEKERSNFSFIRLRESNFKADVHVESANSIKIDIRYVPLDIAEKILTLIKGVL
jgi:hypothetical protein